ncbi:MAG TPA: PIG-L family deacetylase [Thermoanaerobaculia bacterium]|nr:PIG-L family deacetylase [Thermoanaerobaculia bacterium]
MNRRFVLLLIVLGALPAAARSRAVQRPGGLAAPASVLWIAAHPDDEAVAAPLLASWCRDGHVRCAFLLFTRGEAGVCLRPDGCLPDIATARSSEAGAASQYFGAESLLLTLPDGGGSVPPSWNLQAGDQTALIRRVSRFIEAVAPDMILTFDPRHGTTCHPDHRAVGEIVIEAVKLLSQPPDVYFLETRVGLVAEPFAIHFAPAYPTADRFDATLPLTATRGPAWNAIIDDMQHHTSQFDGRWIAAIQNVPSSERAVFIAPAETALSVGVAPCQ